MAQSVIVKKDEKITTVIKSLPDGFSDFQFIEAFIQQYPKEWKRVQKVYDEHEARTKPGKSHPMLEPKKYLINALKIHKKKMSNN